MSCYNQKLTAVSNPVPFFTVIIPSYNSYESLSLTITSVLTQTFPFFELIIVDDASTDRTTELVESFSDNRIRYIRLESN